MTSKTKNYMLSAAITTEKMKATVMKIITTALTITLMINNHNNDINHK